METQPHERLRACVSQLGLTLLLSEEVDLDE